MNPLHRAATQAGVTIVEALMVLCIASILVGTQAGQFSSMLARKPLEGAAAQLETDIQYTRAAAVARNRVLRIDVAADGERSCYIVHTGAAGDCRCGESGTPTCREGVETLRYVSFEPGTPVSLRSNSRSLAFEPNRGTVTPTATFELRNRRDEVVRLVVNIMGRVRNCSPLAIHGQPRC